MDSIEEAMAGLDEITAKISALSEKLRKEMAENSPLAKTTQILLQQKMNLLCARRKTILYARIEQLDITMSESFNKNLEELSNSNNLKRTMQLLNELEFELVKEITNSNKSKTTFEDSSKTQEVLSENAEIVAKTNEEHAKEVVNEMEKTPDKFEDYDSYTTTGFFIR